MQTISLGPLSAVVTPDLSPKEARMTVVLLHGFGAPGTDLVGLAPALAPLPGVRFVFPAAPLALAEIPGGRAWWPIDMLRLQISRLTGQADALAQETPAGLSSAREALSEALDQLFRSHGVSPETLVLGGFSQGAMLSCDVTLRAASPPLGLVQLSGTVIAESEWKPLLPGRAGLPVFQSHSPDDEVLPLSLAVRLGEMMQAAGLRHEFLSFRGGHGIPPVVQAGLKKFLQDRLRALPPSGPESR